MVGFSEDFQYFESVRKFEVVFRVNQEAKMGQVLI